MSSAQPKVAICTTTIFPIDAFVREYAANLQAFDRTRHVRVYIAGDNKSPRGCEDVAAKASFSFLTIERQREYMKRFADLAPLIPENSDNRRNVAFLMALEDGADVVISVDDDNFPLPSVDFIGEHLRVGQDVTLSQAVGCDGWYNLCDLLTPREPRLFPRGFPHNRRRSECGTTDGQTSGRVGINVGLWMNDPDTDAIARLATPVHIDGADGREVLLAPGVRCPINTQNTALSRQAVAAYYYVRMGASLRGLKLDRFGDIFSGYFAQLCADAVGDRIRIGSPVADHRRNPHNLLIDLYHELAGIMMLEDLAGFLSSSLQLPSDSYANAYRALSHKLEDFAARQSGFIWTPETVSYFRDIGKTMRVWADVVASLK